MKYDYRDCMNYGDVAYKKIYNSDKYEVVIQSHERGSVRRICECSLESDAIIISEALQAISDKLLGKQK